MCSKPFLMKKVLNVGWSKIWKWFCYRTLFFCTGRVYFQINFFQLKKEAIEKASSWSGKICSFLFIVLLFISSMLCSTVSIVRGKECYYLPDTIVPTHKVNIFLEVNLISSVCLVFLTNSNTVDAPSLMVHWMKQKDELVTKNCRLLVSQSESIKK